MHGREKSDPAIVAAKPANKAERSGCGAGGAKGGGRGECGPAKHAPDTGPGKRVTGAGPHTASRKAKEEGDSSPRSSTISPSTCSRTPSTSSSEDAAPGVDGLTWKEYEADLGRNLEDLHARVHRGAYRAQPSRRAYIPKPDGRQRPLAIAALEDKIVQRATVDGAERDLRGGLPRVLVRVPARTRSRTMRWTRSRSGSPARR